MDDSFDLRGAIAAAVDHEGEYGRPAVLGYRGVDGFPAVSYRGGIVVHGPRQLAVWMRKKDDGLAKEAVDRPEVTVLYFAPQEEELRYLLFKGRARVDAEANQQVYAAISEAERDRDPEQMGVAVLIDVASVLGHGAAGSFELSDLAAT